MDIYKIKNVETMLVKHKEYKVKSKGRNIKPVSIQYVTKKDIGKLILDEHAVILGQARLNGDAGSKGSRHEVLEIPDGVDSDGNMITHYVDVTPIKDVDKLSMFVHVGNNTYVGLLKVKPSRKLIPIMAVALLTSLFMGRATLYSLCNINNVNPKAVLQFEQDSLWDETTNNKMKEVSKQDSILIPGYSNLYVSKDSRNVKLLNPNVNTVYIQYDIYEGDSIVYSTKAIKPGDTAKANLYDVLGEGYHKLVFVLNTYDTSTHEMCNSTQQEVSLLVK